MDTTLISAYADNVIAETEDGARHRIGWDLLRACAHGADAATTRGGTVAAVRAALGGQDACRLLLCRADLLLADAPQRAAEQAVYAALRAGDAVPHHQARLCAVLAAEQARNPDVGPLRDQRCHDYRDEAHGYAAPLTFSAAVELAACVREEVARG